MIVTSFWKLINVAKVFGRPLIMKICKGDSRIALTDVIYREA